MKNNHARSLCPCFEGLHTDVDADWSIGHWRSCGSDSWIGHGYALGALGERFGRHVPPGFVHVGYLCGNSCLLCRHSRLPHVPEIHYQRCRQMVEDQWWRIFACIRFVLVGIRDFSSCNHAQSTASHRWSSSPHPVTRCSQNWDKNGSILSSG